MLGRCWRLVVKPLVLSVAVLAACGPVPLATTQSEASLAVPDWLPPRYYVPWNSARPPLLHEPEIKFAVRQGDCSSTNDGGAHSDCAMGITRSVIATEGMELGHQNHLGFEFWIDPALSYRGHRTGPGDGFTSRLSIARWEGIGPPDRLLFDLKVDATRGVTFLGKTCIPPTGFGSWHRFDMRIRWADDRTGFIEVRCDSRPIQAGVPIFAVSNISTNQMLQCLEGNDCAANARNGPARFRMELGIHFKGESVAGRRLLPRIPGETLTVKMRRLVWRRLYVIFGRVEAR